MNNEQQPNLDALRKMLREAGLRVTPGRVAVLEFLLGLKRPVSHQEVSDQLDRMAVDKSTLFRALQDLVEAGLARRMELGDHVWRYELTRTSGEGGESDQPHPHLLCVDCGRITCLADDDVEIAVPKSLGTIEEVLLKGHCSDCGPAK